MLVDLNLRDKTVVVLGGGAESELKTRKLLDAGAKVTVISNTFNSHLRRLGKSGRINLLKAGTAKYERLLRSRRPYALIVATEHHDNDNAQARTAKSTGALVCVVDRPNLNDFNMPAIARIGDVRVAVSTGGLSPAMAGLLRRRIERLIKPEDALQVKLQGHIRKIIKQERANPKTRKELVYKVIHDRKISSLLRRKLYSKAKVRAEQIIQNN